MQKRTLAATAALLVAASLHQPRCLADGTPAPDQVEAEFRSARLADDLRGVLGSPGKETRVRIFASAGSKVSATLVSDGSEGTPVAGLTMTLCDDAGTQVPIGASDVSVPGSGTIAWKKVPLPATTGYAFILRGTGAGVWRLTLSGTLATVRERSQSPADLGVGVETSVDVQGLRGGVLSFALTPDGKSKFRGELVRIERPDGSSVPGLTADVARGRATLDADGVHRLVFRNGGNGLGAWIATATVKPPKLLRRRGYVRPEGTALVPAVTKVTPANGFHRDVALDVTIAGRDFQSGADVRLIRAGDPDIVATAVRVLSETSLACTLDLDTAPTTGESSLGTWRVAVTNAPATYDATLQPSRDASRTFASVSSSSISLPRGVVKGTEVWQLDFNSDFQKDLDRMGLGSSDPPVEQFVREAVEAYVVCFLRTLLLANETTGKVAKNVSPPISFVVGDVPPAAGKAGTDFNRIEIGGARQDGDERDAAEPLLWGFAPLDPGNAHRDDLSQEVDDGNGGTTRVGRGARTRVLDPDAPDANADWISVTGPLRRNPLTAADRRYMAGGFVPSSVSDANRYRDIVVHVTRASREIAAIVAHHIGRAMGLPAGGTGPMANPASAGYLWPTTEGLEFTGTDREALRAAAVPHEMPGNSSTLTITFFPLIGTQPSLLPNAIAAVDYSVNWNFVGGRANALPRDYTVRLISSIRLLGTLRATFQGFTMTDTPLYADSGLGFPYCGVTPDGSPSPAYFRLNVTDDVRGARASFLYRLNMLPNLDQLPSSGIVHTRAVNCQNAILATP